MADSLNIFLVLEYLDENNMELYEAVKDDENLLKDLEKNIGWLIPQWFTGSPNEDVHRALILSFNELCNVGWHNFYKHPQLQAKLLASAGLGKSVRHKFFRPSTKKLK